MRRFLHLSLLLIGLLAFSSSALAQDAKALLGKDVFFEPGGGVRARYLNLWEGAGKAFGDQQNQVGISHRFQVDLLMHKGEFFQTFARLIHVNQWGRQSQADGDSSVAIRDSFTGNNGLFVNQAWGLWKLTESFGVRFGRSSIQLGSGKTYGLNDWFNHPYSYDNFELFSDWESVKVALIGAKVQELEGLTGGATGLDPEENHFILDIDVQNIADWIKMMDFHLVQVNRDMGSADGGATAVSSLNVQRLGIDFQFQTRRMTGELYMGYVSGDENTATIQGSVRQSVLDLKLNYNIPTWNNMNIYAIGHVDSGDKDLADAVNQHYDGFYYDVYGQSGRMEFIRWGNLQAYGLGITLEATSNLDMGVEVWSFAKSSGVDRMEFGQAGRLLAAGEASGDIVFQDTDTAIGSEMDLFATFQFPSQVEVSFTTSAFMPGNVFRNATTSSGIRPSATIIQLMAEISLFF